MLASMMKSIQVAFQLPEQDLAAVDKLVPEPFPSRSEVLRLAVQEWLHRRQEAGIDAALAAGYGARPPGEAEGRWAELSVEALARAELDW